MRRVTFLAVALIAATPLALVLAQNPAQPRPGQPAQPGQPRAGAQQQPMDPHLAACLIIDNQLEVAVAEIAQQKASDEKVKEFARKMVEDHTQMISKLDRFAPGVSRMPLRVDAAGGEERDATDANRRPQPGENPAPRDNQRTPDRTDDAPAAAQAQPRAAQPAQPGAAPQPAALQPAQPGQPIAQPGQPRPQPGLAQANAMINPQQFVAMKRELAQECLKALQKEIGDKSGKEFDECYMTHQAMAHQMMVTQLTVFRRHSSPAFQQVLDEGLQTTQEHLKHAKDLVKSLDGDTKTAGKEKDAKAE